MCCGSRQAGHRVGEHLEKVIPLIVKFSQVEDDELREYCLQAFESFVRRCPKDISPHIPMVNCGDYICTVNLFCTQLIHLHLTLVKFLFPLIQNSVEMFIKRHFVFCHVSRKLCACIVCSGMLFFANHTE